MLPLPFRPGSLGFSLSFSFLAGVGVCGGSLSGVPLWCFFSHWCFVLFGGAVGVAPFLVCGISGLS